MGVRGDGKGRLQFIVLPAALARTAGAARAVDRAWLNPVSGSWIVNGNWTPSGFPNNGDTAMINVASVSPYAVTLANGVTISSLTLNHPQATLQVNPGAGLVMGTGPINVSAGTFSMGAASLTGTGTFTLSPGATLSLSGCAMPSGMTYSLGGNVIVQNTVQGFTTAGFTNNGSMTLTGAGLAWLFCPPLTNNGTITADGVGGGTARLQARITNSATGVINLQTNTETFTSPQNNSGIYTLAAGKTLAIGSFATFNQTAGTMTLSGAYSHLNGTFNMNGGTLSIPAGGSMLKDGGNFNYNGGTISGSPTLHNAFLSLNPLATNAASFAMRGPNNGLGGEIRSNESVRVESTASESGGLGVGLGTITNNGTMTFAPTTAQAVTVSAGTLANFGSLVVQSPAVTDGERGLVRALLVMLLGLDNKTDAELVEDHSTELQLDAIAAQHRNSGTIGTAAGTPGQAPGAITISAGSAATFTQEAGAIHNDGEFNVEQGCTFEFNGGECTGNHIVMKSATLEIGPDAGKGAFRCLGGSNIITADEIPGGVSVEIVPDASLPGSGQGDAMWSPSGFVMPALNGALTLAPDGQQDARLTMQQTLFVQPTGVIGVTPAGGPAHAVIDVHGLPLTVRGRIEWEPLMFRGADEPRVSAGTVVELLGDYTQEATGTLAPKIRGVGESDVLDLSGGFGGVATLGGTLEIGLGAGYTPAWGDVATVMAYALHLGDFATFSAPALNPSLRWYRIAGATAYNVGVRHVADTNHDGHVDFLDLNNVLSYYGMPAPGGSAASIGDANGDGVVDFLDLNQVLGAFGQSAT